MFTITLCHEGQFPYYCLSRVLTFLGSCLKSPVRDEITVAQPRECWE
jgi:hypothetical protein